MEPLKFLHTADWHLGASFTQFDANDRVELSQARYKAIEQLFIYAKQNQIPMILCAGDQFDKGQHTDKERLIQLWRIIKSYDPIKVIMITGNHDPCMSNSIYTKVERSEYPKNLYFIDSEKERLEIPELSVRIFASSIMDKHGIQDPLEWIQEDPMDTSFYNIGLAHGGLDYTHFDNPTRIDPNLPFRKQLDYLALGDWHSFHKANERTYYSGTHESMKFEDESYVLDVTVPNPTGIPMVNKRKVELFTWNSTHITVEDSNIERVRKDLAAISKHRTINKLLLTGQLSPHEFNTFHDFLSMNKDAFHILENQVEIRNSDESLLELSNDYMQSVIQSLLDMKASDTPLPEALEHNMIPGIFERDTLRELSESLLTNKTEIIDNALMRIYNYYK